MNNRKPKLWVWLLMGSMVLTACSQANSQSRRETLPGKEVLPGSEMIDASFFQPFSTQGKIMEVSGSNEKLFREISKEMQTSTVDGMEVIIQELTYTLNGNTTGKHTTHYDPNTLQVVYWEYKGKDGKPHFAFKSDGTKLSGTQNPGANAKWQDAELGIGLFQNESREMLFRGLHASEKGTQVKFPIIGMNPPFHGWVSYEYSRDEEVEVSGTKKMAKIWSSTGDPRSYYAVIDEAPYVIKRVTPSGKKSAHVFSYELIK